MKKVLFVCPSLAAGGAEKAAISISNYLVKTYNYDISFLTFIDDMFLKDSLNEKIKLLGINNSKLNQSSSSTIRSVKLFREVIKTNQIDIIISTNELSSELPIILSKTSIPKKTKIITIIQNTPKQLFSDYNFKTKLLYYLVTNMRRYVFDKAIVVSSHIKSELKNFKNISVISNPLVITEGFESIRQKYFDEGKKNRYFVSVSRISKQKNLKLLLRAFKLVEKDTEKNLIIIGSIGDEDEYSRLVKLVEKFKLTKRIEFQKPGNNYFKLLINAEAFLFTSRYEGFPLSLLEAMYCKVPIISTKFIGHDQLLNDENAKIVDDYSPELFAKAILNFENIGVCNGQIGVAEKKSTNYHISKIGKLYHEEIINL